MSLSNINSMAFCRYFILLLLMFTDVSVSLSDASDTPKMDSNNKLKERLTATIMECQKTTRASEVDISAIREKRIPSSHEGQCLVECVFSATSIMTNGNFDKKNALKVLTPHMKGDAVRTEKLKQMLEICDKEIGKNSDKCATAKKVVECTQKHGKEFGFQMPIHI